MASSKYNPTVETFSDFLKRVKIIVKHAFQGNAVKSRPTLLFRKIPITIQQDIMNNNKGEASPKKTKTFLHRRQLYNNFCEQQCHRRSTKHQWANLTPKDKPINNTPMQNDTPDDLTATAFIGIKVDTEKLNAGRRLALSKMAQLNRESGNHQTNKRRVNPTTEN